LRAQIIYKLGDYKQAVDTYEKILQTQENDA
jgi:tetratricopeptide (TPR) repeat protein